MNLNTISGKKVKIAIPSSRDEVILESIRLVLDSIFEPQFSPYSHGLRPGYSRQTALRMIRNNFKGMDYYISFEIAEAMQDFTGCEMVDSICNKIFDEQFKKLLLKSIDIGYINFYGLESKDIISTPREMGISPILLNIFLHSFDTWLEEYKNCYSDKTKFKRWPLSNSFTKPSYRRFNYLIKVN